MEALEEVEPEYDETPTLSDDDLGALERLERLGILEVSDGGAAKYSHPYYRAAESRWLANRPTCDRRNGSDVATGNVLCVTGDLQGDGAEPGLDLGSADGQRRPAQVVECAIDGLNSSFPGTRDICYGFLMDQFEAPTIQERMPESLRSWTSAVTKIDLFELRWRGGDAYLRPARFWSADELFERFLDLSSAADIEADLELLNAGLWECQSRTGVEGAELLPNGAVCHDAHCGLATAQLRRGSTESRGDQNLAWHRGATTMARCWTESSRTGTRVRSGGGQRGDMGLA